MFNHRPPHIRAGNYYINYENEKFILACRKESFKPNFRDNIPADFEKKDENTFVAMINREQPLAISSLITALDTLIDGPEIHTELQAYINNTARSSLKRY